jgi:Endoplasmic Reticulum Oxidoreductin 1 (ERO1)
VWKAIYKENCFTQNKCMEERLLAKALSGMHASVSSHLSEYYVHNFDVDTVQYTPNITMYFEKVGDHADRLSNLYFANTLILRAMNRASDVIKSMDISTGSFMEDIETRKLLGEMIKDIQMYCDKPFNEDELFKDQAQH